MEKEKIKRPTEGLLGNTPQHVQELAPDTDERTQNYFLRKKQLSSDVLEESSRGSLNVTELKKDILHTPLPGEEEKKGN